MSLEIKQVLWKSGYANRGVDAQKVYDFTEQLRSENGGELSTAQVLDAARIKRSPIHKLFEWNDSEAAEQFRIKQASDMLRSIHVVYLESPELEVRAYEVTTHPPVGKPDLRGRYTFYSTTSEILEDPVKRDALLIEAIRQLTAWRRKFSNLTELQKVVASIDAALIEIGTS